MKNLFLVLLLSLGVANAQLYIVNEPDVAQEGWYWDPAGSGWGLNMTIQPSSLSPTGFYLQGAAYTYDADGKPLWYTFQNPYTPNEDVFAWREGRGPLASFEAPLAETSGGGCIDCPHAQPQVFASEKGNIQLEWSDPLHMSMTVGGVTKELKHYFFHADLNQNNIDFITQRVWFVHAALDLNFVNGFHLVKGATKFVELSDDVKASIESLPENHVVLSDQYKWFISDEGFLSNYMNNSTENIFTSGYTDTATTSAVLLGYNTSNGKVIVFIVSKSFPGLIPDTYYTRLCGADDQSVSFSGLFRPAVSQTTRLYFNYNDDVSQCEGTSLGIDWERQQFVDLTMLPVGFEDLSSVKSMFDPYKRF